MQVTQAAAAKVAAQMNRNKVVENDKVPTVGFTGPIQFRYILQAL